MLASRYFDQADLGRMRSEENLSSLGILLAVGLRELLGHFVDWFLGHERQSSMRAGSGATSSVRDSGVPALAGWTA